MPNLTDSDAKVVQELTWSFLASPVPGIFQSVSTIASLSRQLGFLLETSGRDTAVLLARLEDRLVKYLQLRWFDYEIQKNRIHQHRQHPQPFE